MVAQTLLDFAMVPPILHIGNALNSIFFGESSSDLSNQPPPTKIFHSSTSSSKIRSFQVLNDERIPLDLVQSHFYIPDFKSHLARDSTLHLCLRDFGRTISTTWQIKLKNQQIPFIFQSFFPAHRWRALNDKDESSWWLRQTGDLVGPGGMDLWWTFLFNWLNLQYSCILHLDSKCVFGFNWRLKRGEIFDFWFRQNLDAMDFSGQQPNQQPFTSAIESVLWPSNVRKFLCPQNCSFRPFPDNVFQPLNFILYIQVRCVLDAYFC